MHRVVLLRTIGSESHTTGHAIISKMTPRFQVGSHFYERVDDPDTGEPLGAYIYKGKGSETAS